MFGSLTRRGAADAAKTKIPTVIKKQELKYVKQ